MADETAPATTEPVFTPTPPVQLAASDPPFQCGRCGSLAVNWYGDFCFTCGASAPGLPFRGGPKPPDAPPTA